MIRCLNCFEEYSEEYDICPHCGQVMDFTPQEPIYLAPGYLLNDRYTIGYTIGHGGFGIIYKAWDNKLETVVAIKEFYVSRINQRAAGRTNVIISKNGVEEFKFRKNRFITEAKNMAKFGTHKSIPNVFEVFEANNTAYIVMELLVGSGLNEMLNDEQNIIDKDFAIYVTNEIGNALTSLHQQNIIHRDVAPDNIYICSDKNLRIKLLDLGAALLPDSKDDVIDIVLKPGYSPVEQYDATMQIGQYSDVYALGATLYVMLTGVKPDESTSRKIEDIVVPPHDLNPEIDVNLSNAIMKAMAIEPHMRYQTVKDFLDAINSGKKVVSLAVEKKQRKAKRFAGILVSFIAVVVAGLLFFTNYQSKKREVILDKADITVWYRIDSENEQNAMIEVVNDFLVKNTMINIDLHGFTPEEYEEKLEEALAEGALPTLFESTGVSDSIVEKATDLDKVMTSEQFTSSLFLDQYENYYSDKKRMPIAVEIPLACVITKSNSASLDYSETVFNSLSDFGKAKIAMDEDHVELLVKSFPGTYEKKGTFMNNSKNTSAVLLTSTLEISSIKQTLTNYPKVFVYYKNAICNYTYEFSIGNGTKQEIAAAEKMLSWMLGNVYQNMLMISRNNNGEIPVDKTAFDEKTGSSSAYEGLTKVYETFIFKK